MINYDGRLVVDVISYVNIYILIYSTMIATVILKMDLEISQALH